MVEAAGEARLTSPAWRQVWEPGSAFASTCPRYGHGAPRETCSCGVYAAKSPLLPALYVRVPRTPEHYAVIGRVSLWGTVVECEEGWRAAFAYPACIFVPKQAGVSRPGRDVFGALSAYGVPVLPFAWPGTWGPLPQPQLPFFPKAAA